MENLSPKRLADLRKDKGLSQKEVADYVGVSQRSYSMWEAGETKPKHESTVKLIELFFGEHASMQKKTSNNDGIPLLPIEATAGVFTGDVQVMEFQAERYRIPVFKDADFLIPIRGASMYPKYSSGDIVACKKLESWTFFQYGKVYVLYTDQGPIIKRIKEGKDDDHVLVVSENEERYPPFQLHRKEIKGVAIVVGVIRLE